MFIRILPCFQGLGFESRSDDRMKRHFALRPRGLDPAGCGGRSAARGLQMRCRRVPLKLCLEGHARLALPEGFTASRMPGEPSWGRKVDGLRGPGPPLPTAPSPRRQVTAAAPQAAPRPLAAVKGLASPGIPPWDGDFRRCREMAPPLPAARSLGAGPRVQLHTARRKPLGGSQMSGFSCPPRPPNLIFLEDLRPRRPRVR